jgi:predicted Fe-S protein YdhL (DUF1289 family)
MNRRIRSIHGILYILGLPVVLFGTTMNGCGSTKSSSSDSPRSHPDVVTGTSAASAFTTSPQGGGKRSSSMDINNKEDNNNDESVDLHGTSSAPVPLLLPSKTENDENVTSIKLGETISFEQLGPIILNTDGTTRRIDNWNSLSKQEQDTTWRRIKQRNAKRREFLLRQQENEQQSQENISQTQQEL